MTQHNLQGERMNLGGTGFQPVLAQLWEMGSWGEGQGPEVPALPPHPSPNPQKGLERQGL